MAGRPQDEIGRQARHSGEPQTVHFGPPGGAWCRTDDGWPRHELLLQTDVSARHDIADDLAPLVEPPSEPVAERLPSTQGAIFCKFDCRSTIYCHIAPPFQTDVKLSGSYPLPWWGVALSATFQSIPGPPIVATAVVPNFQIAPSLGRDLGAGGNSTVTVQPVAPGALYGSRSVIGAGSDRRGPGHANLPTDSARERGSSNVDEGVGASLALSSHQ